MEIILLETIKDIGEAGQVVTVKPGIARNFLLPQEKALRATKANLARFEAERKYLEQRNAAAREVAEENAKKIEGQSAVLIRKADDDGNLYGSVSSRDIAEQLGKLVKRNMIKLDQPIKALGLYNLTVALHPEVRVSIRVNVARTEDEAERQDIGLKGEDIELLTQHIKSLRLTLEARLDSLNNTLRLMDSDLI